MCPSRGILLSLVLIAVCHFPSRVVLAQSSPIPVIKIDGQEATPTDTVTVTAFESVWLVSESYDDDEGGCCIVQTDWYLNGAGYRFYRGDSTLFAFHDSLSIQSIKLIIKDDEVQYGSLTVPVKVVTATTEQLSGRQYYLKDHLGSIRATVNDTGAVGTPVTTTRLGWRCPADRRSWGPEIRRSGLRDMNLMGKRALCTRPLATMTL